MTVKCPGCGRFMAYDAYYGRWQCRADWCGRVVTMAVQPDPPGPDWKNPGIGRALLDYPEGYRPCLHDPPSSSPAHAQGGRCSKREGHKGSHGFGPWLWAAH